jgi:RND family efflux transporter MFP subunit
MSTSEPQAFPHEIDPEIYPGLNAPVNDDHELSSTQKFRWIWLMLGGLLLLGGGFFVWRAIAPNFAASEQQMQMPPGVLVDTQTVTQTTLEDSSEFIGNLEAVQGVDLRPEISGRITQIYVSEGDRVTVGDPIVQISPDRTQAELNAAIANVNAALATRNSAQAQLQSQEADRIRAAAEVELQQSQYERTAMLVTEGVRSRQDLDIATRDLNTARAAYEAADRQVQAATANLAQANAVLQQAQAETQAVQTDLADTTVAAPISGIVSDMPVKLGTVVNIGDTLTALIENEALDLRLSVPMEQASQLRVGLPVELRTSTSDTSLGRGQISFISPTATAEAQVVLAKATFPNPTGQLRDRQSVLARVIWSTRPGVVVPTSAISRLGGQTFVYVVESQTDPDTGEAQLVASQRPVTLGTIQGNDYQVLDGLQAGEEIVVSGLLNLFDGAPILRQSDMMAPDGAASEMPPQL